MSDCNCAAHGLAATRNFLLAEDVDLLHELANQMRSHNPWIVDLGAGSGTTALAVLEKRPEASITTIDISVENLWWSALAVRNAFPDAAQRTVFSDSAAAAYYFADGELDLVLIDTSHTYEQTVAELAAWWWKLDLLGMIWLHDYDGPESEGVRRAVDEAVARGEFITYRTAGWSWSGTRGMKPR